MSILKELEELTNANIISQETADKITDFYESKKSFSYNKLFIIFGILGAILVGLGIILIIAHNWDNLSRQIKTTFALAPMIIGQIIAAYVILKKYKSTAWTESSSIFLFFTVGAAISLISQIYNMPGELSSFILLWMLLILPIIYLLKSSATSLLYLIGITTYAVETGYGFHNTEESITYWLLLIAILPYYYMLYKNKPTSNFMTFHNWLIPGTLIITLGTIANNNEELMYIAYFSLFALYLLIGNLKSFKSMKFINQGYHILGSLGTVFLLLLMSFNWFWEDINDKTNFNYVFTSAEFITATIITILATILLVYQRKKEPLTIDRPYEYVYLLFIIFFIVGISTTIPVIFINILAFALGVLTIRKGAKKDHLGLLNYGLLLITALITCRFFDTDLNFIFRGLMFITVGIGFFITNYKMLKKRQKK